MKIRLITPVFPAKGFRTLTLPVLASEFEDFADVEINDESIEQIDLSHCDIAAISAFIFQLPGAFEIARRFKETGAKVIMGGTGPSALPDLCLKHADSVVIGEIEGLGKRIVSDAKKGRLRKVYRNDNVPDMKSTKRPRTDLQRKNRYPFVNFPIEFTRGCPFHCTFCFSKDMFECFRTRSINDIRRDLEGRDADVVGAVDLNIGGSPEHLKKVARLISEYPGVEWDGELHIAALDDDELLRLLEKSNFHAAYVGIESISERSLKSVGKRHNNPQRYADIIKKCQDHGIMVQAGYVMGLDGEDKSIFERSLEFFEKVRIWLVTPTFVTFMPGSPVWKKFKNEGRILTERLEDYDGIHPIVKPDMMSVDELMEGAEWFIKEFFGLRSNLLRAIQKPVFSSMRGLGSFAGLSLATSLGYRLLIKKDKWGRSAFNSREIYDHWTEKKIPNRSQAGKILFTTALGALRGRIDLKQIDRIWQDPPINSRNLRDETGSTLRLY